jgi:archaetidylinositol phosphate synthase
MNITALRPRFSRYLQPIAGIFARIGITPNQVSLLSLLFGVLAAYLYFRQQFVGGSVLLFISAGLDLTDGGLARTTGNQTKFGAVFDWIIDKYVDALVLLGIGLSGVAILSRFAPMPGYADFAVAAAAIIGSLMNTFIKPVVYAEIGFQTRVEGKIEDPLEGIGFFGRPETLLVLIAGGIVGYIWIAVIIVAVCTNLSAVQRIVYLYRTLG